MCMLVTHNSFLGARVSPVGHDDNGIVGAGLQRSTAGTSVGTVHVSTTNIGAFRVVGNDIVSTCGSSQFRCFLLLESNT